MKENVQVSADIGATGLPINSSPDMSKDYEPENFGVKDIESAKPKYKVYKKIKKK
jgi:hypothetical protein